MKRRAATLFMLILAATVASAQLDPIWTEYEQGRRLFRHGEYSEALRSFRAILERNPTMPEALYHIGLIYEQNGDSSQALRYYNRALEGGAFRLGGTRIEVYYTKAKLLYSLGRIGEYESVMSELFTHDEDFSGEQTADHRENQLRVLLRERGSLAQVLVLYRLDPGPFALPHRDYGIYLLTEGGRFEEAVPHLFFSLLDTYSRAIEFYRRKNPRYEFVDLYRFEEDIRFEREIRDFLRDRETYRTLNALADAIYFGDNYTRGRELWHFVSRQEAADEQAAYAIRQLSADGPINPGPPLH